MRLRFGAAIAPLAALLGCVSPAVQVAPPPVQPASPPAAAAYEGAIFVEGALEQGGWLRGTVPPGTVRLTLGSIRVTVDREGRFFAGIDRDAPAALRLTGMGPNGQTITRDLAVAPRAWPIERVNVPLRGSVPSETYMVIRRPELAAIEAARRG